MYLSNFYEPWLGKKSFSKKWDTSKLKKVGITLKYSNTAPKERIIKCYFFDEGVWSKELISSKLV